MLEEMDKRIDAVTVSTPDHIHAVGGVMAMRMGKHCFCQKPLTHTIYEARLMAQVAREMKVATQMGNQGTAETACARPRPCSAPACWARLTRCTSGRTGPIWPQGGAAAHGSGRCRRTLNWDLWLGPAPCGLTAKGYHPFSWRGWWDFGSGALGDMACHTVNMPFMGLDLRNPTSVVAKTSGHNKDSYPKWSVITFEFAANDQRPAGEVDLVRRRQTGSAPTCWKADKLGGSGCLVVGEKAKFLAGRLRRQFPGLRQRETAREIKYPRVARPFRGMGPRDPRRPGGHVELPRLRRPR